MGSLTIGATYLFGVAVKDAHKHYTDEQRKSGHDLKEPRTFLLIILGYEGVS